MKHLLTMLLLVLCCRADAQYMISTIAGNGVIGYSGGDGGPATAAGVADAYGVTVDRAGNIYISQDYRVRKVDASGIITTYAGNGTPAYSGDGVPATATGLIPHFMAVDASGNLYITDPNNYRILKVDATTRIISTVAGNGIHGHSGDGGPATAAEMTPLFIAMDNAGNIYVKDSNWVRRVDATTGIITTVAGNGTSIYSGDGGPATAAGVGPRGLAVDRSGNLYIVDQNNYRIRMVTPAGIISTYAGTGVPGYSGDGGPATAAQFSLMQYGGLFADGLGNLYIGDDQNFRIRKVNAFGIITTIAGNGTYGFRGDGGPATTAEIGVVYSIARNGIGNIYFADGGNDRVRMLSTITYFVNGSLQSANVCPGTISIDTLLAANDSSSGVTETWSLISGPYHGSVSASYTTITTGGIVMPSGTTYTVLPGYTGADTFSVRITDGVISDTTMVIMHVRSGPDAGTITGLDSVCVFWYPVSLTDTVSGGVWAAINGHATVSHGAVQGVSPGRDTIIYTVSNTCGTDTAFFPITVFSSVECGDGVHRVNSGEYNLSISPIPCYGPFTCTLSSATNKEMRISVTDLTGRKILETTSQTNKPTPLQIDGPAGVYFLNATTKDGAWSAKVVVY
jgi:hypothetical protein